MKVQSQNQNFGAINISQIASDKGIPNITSVNKQINWAIGKAAEMASAPLNLGRLDKDTLCLNIMSKNGSKDETVAFQMLNRLLKIEPSLYKAKIIPDDEAIVQVSKHRLDNVKELK
ncbi:MAG: hypothetical protein WCF95_03635 [bacterium]